MLIFYFVIFFAKMKLKQLLKLSAVEYVINFIVAVFVFGLCRVVFYVSNIDFYSGNDFPHIVRLFFGGLRFDIAAIFYLTIISFVMLILPFRFTFKKNYRTIAKYFFVIPISFGVLVNVFDAAFFRFNARRTNFSFFNEFSNENNLFGIFVRGLLDYWYLDIVAVGLIFIMVKFYWSCKLDDTDCWSKKYTVKVLPLTLLMIYFFMAGIRGSFFIDADHRPMNMNNANEYIKKSNESAVVLNTPYCIIRTAGKITFSNPHYFDDDKLENIYSPIHCYKKETSFKKLNVVILILESFGKEYSGLLNRDLFGESYKGYTPF